ncbi:uncharacterized protein LY79DRAFT_697510 [Colletotrichum navitas]|uniref:Uncharacterized protein n=1 Tax=Colletotrichum navitas TaxID=681940 RepID=A0AAD8PNN7_9PEZI|nr:uncharacterized protein LY79DRAFT_697510 [Colletotrichum navitas]KAK1573481.1 hypothetical protein LY79DRAFT_697510 [Colletotrichum navitas]
MPDVAPPHFFRHLLGQFLIFIASSFHRSNAHPKTDKGRRVQYPVHRRVPEMLHLHISTTSPLSVVKTVSRIDKTSHKQAPTCCLDYLKVHAAAAAATTLVHLQFLNYQLALGGSARIKKMPPSSSRYTTGGGHVPRPGQVHLPKDGFSQDHRQACQRDPERQILWSSGKVPAAIQSAMHNRRCSGADAPKSTTKDIIKATKTYEKSATTNSKLYHLRQDNIRCTRSSLRDPSDPKLSRLHKDLSPPRLYGPHHT